MEIKNYKLASERKTAIQAPRQRISASTRHILQHMKDMAAVDDRLSLALSKREAASHKHDQGASYAYFLYNPDDPYLQYTEEAKSMGIFVDRSMGISKRTKPRENPSNWDIFSAPVRGLTLIDIEQMPQPLDLEDIARINRMVRNNPFSKLENSEQVVAETALTLPTQYYNRINHLNGNKHVNFPHTLTDLSLRMSEYMDYYTKFLTSQNTNLRDYYMYSINLAWVGTNLWDSLGHYIPARLGISPASTLKLIEGKLGGLSFIGRRLIEHISHEAQDSHNASTLPSHLGKYLHYSPDMDKAATSILSDYYSEAGKNSQPSGIEAKDTMDRLSLYKKALRQEVEVSKKELRVKLPDHPAIGEVIVTNQYPQTIMFVLLFRRDQTHLTLEVNGTERIYGIPGNLLSENPHIDDLIGRDIFLPILDQMRRKYAGIEHLPVIRVNKTPCAFPAPVVIEKGDNDLDINLEPTQPKRKTLVLKYLLAPVTAQPELPPAVEERKPVLTVYHTRSDIRRQLGKNPDESIVDRIMESISRVEYGDKRVESVEVDHELCKIRVGHYRVIFRRLGNGDLLFEKAGHRSVVYNDL